MSEQRRRRIRLREGRMRMVKISGVMGESAAYACGVRSGDQLIAINGNEINDVLDYRFYLAERIVTLSLLRDGCEFSVTIKKKRYDDIGLDFETPLMDKKHSCANKCIFCFVDQMPSGLRDSLYFKDDDSRLSFLHGNYITMTNLTDKDVARIIKMRFSPINISVHTTNPELRVRMMKNKRAGEVLRYMYDLKAAGLTMHAQIVLCKGINDGAELERTMRELSELYPELDSVSVVPCGMTKFREGLYPIEDFTAEEAGQVIDEVDSFAVPFKTEHGGRLFFVSDEFYLKAGRDIPDADYYEDYPQLENGVGMLRSLYDEFGESVKDIASDLSKLRLSHKISLVTGVAAYPLICKMCERLETVFGKLKINVYKIINNFFGESITVSGLLTGKDICEQLDGKDLGEALFIPPNTLRSGDDVFLCGMHVPEMSERLGVPVRVSGEDGFAFTEAIRDFLAEAEWNGAVSGTDA